jgi:hypothetical protein
MVCASQSMKRFRVSKNLNVIGKSRMKKLKYLQKEILKLNSEQILCVMTVTVVKVAMGLRHS